jgi:hypothetical protein
MQASREDKRLKGRCNFIVFKRAYVKFLPKLTGGFLSSLAD